MNNDEKIKEYKAHKTPAPSYEEWKRFIDANDRLFEAVKSLTIERDMTQEENQKLKELLKECRHIMSIEADFASCHFEKKKLIELIEIIDEAL